MNRNISISNFSGAITVLSIVIFTISNLNSRAQNWHELGKVAASDRVEGDFFGFSVDVHGDRAIVGAYEVNDHRGGIYFYKYEGGTWVETQKITLDSADLNARLGKKVAIFENHAVVSADGQNEDADGELLLDGGAAYVYKLDGDVWSEMQMISSSDRQDYDQFGQELAIGDNRIVAATAFQDFDAEGNNYVQTAGAAYVFELIDSTWVETQKLVASDRTDGDRFGTSVSIFEDHIAVGASVDSHDENGENHLVQAGSAYVFEYDNGQWEQSQKIVAEDREVMARFGRDLAIYGDLLLVGAPEESEDANGNDPLIGAGAAYLFRNDGSNWSQVQKITAPERSVDDIFGYVVDLSGDHALITVPLEDDDTTGASYIHDAGGAFVYGAESGMLMNPQPLYGSDRAENNDVGSSGAVSENHVVLGSFGNDYDQNGENYMDNAGAVYFFNYMEPDGILETTVPQVAGVYPNPTSDLITLDIPDYVNSVEVFNSLGELVTIETSKTFSISGLFNGTYFLRAATDETVYRSMVVKK